MPRTHIHKLTQPIAMCFTTFSSTLFAHLRCVKDCAETTQTCHASHQHLPLSHMKVGSQAKRQAVNGCLCSGRLRKTYTTVTTDCSFFHIISINNTGFIKISPARKSEGLVSSEGLWRDPHSKYNVEKASPT